MKIIAQIAIISLYFHTAAAQDTNYARSIVDKLSAPKMHGRGYIKKGAVKAATFIAGQMKSAGLLPIENSYFQEFAFPVNTISKTKLKIGQKTMVPGVDYLVNADAPSYSQKVLFHRNTQIINNKLLQDSQQFMRLVKGWTDMKMDWLVIDTINEQLRTKYKTTLHGILDHFNTLSLTNSKFTWTVSTERKYKINIELQYSSIVKLADFFSLSLTVKSNVAQTTQSNVVGMLPGTLKPDSFIFITAHYDHLGQMGSAVFPGANDNAAGIAMLLDMAKYYKNHPTKFTLVFIAFAGEEAGLIGSGYYVQHPLFPLDKMRFLLNLDLVGTGETGMTVVNATVFTPEYEQLLAINKTRQYVPEIRRRGKAANSDHYFFTEAGVHSFFWYQSGPRTSYHDVYDLSKTLSLAGYIGTFKLAIDFLGGL